MKSDITRSTFDSAKGFTGVRQQQGRVQLDSDWNEQVDIQSHILATETADIIGPAGGPIGNLGFGLSAAAGQLVIGAGHYYVDGLLLENLTAVNYSAQPDFPGAPAIQSGKKYLVYLNVFEQLVTALEDPEIMESALGGPDTCTRTRRVWQVGLLESSLPGLHCLSNDPDWIKLTAPSSIQMKAFAEPDAPAKSPCIVPATAGYRALENRLYRVEIRDAGTNPTFVWSRENGSVAAVWSGTSGLELTIADAPKDDVRAFNVGDWIELIDLDRELRGESGPLVQITAVDGTKITIASLPAGTFVKVPRIRRWDMASSAISVPSNSTAFVELEDGVRVSFKKGTCRTGDFWLIPARTLKRNVEWPGGSTPEFITPHGVQHHFARIGALDTTTNPWTITDCRTPFPSLTDIIALTYVSGDGQEGTPDLSDLTKRVPLPPPLIVGVSRGRHPVVGARVRFEVKVGQLSGDAQTGFSIDVLTKAGGLATCVWELDPNVTTQLASATMLDANNDPVHLPVIFNASLSLATEVAYRADSDCSALSAAKTVQEALDTLCQIKEEGSCCEVTVGDGGDYPLLDLAISDLFIAKKRTRVSICLMAQETDHKLTKGLDLPFKNASLTIRGAGTASHVILSGKPITVEGLDSFSLIDVSIKASGIPDAIRAAAVRTMRISGCSIALSGTSADSAAIRSKSGTTLTVSGNQISATFFKALLDKISKFDSKLADLLIADDAHFSANLAIEATRLAKSKVADRRTALDKINFGNADSARLTTAALDSAILADFREPLEVTKDISDMTAILDRLRVTLFQSFPVACIHVETPTTTTIIENNLMSGNIAFYGGTPTVLNADHMERTATFGSRGAYRITPTTAGAWVRGNRFSRFLLGDSIAKLLTSDNGAEFTAFREIRFEDNTIESGNSASLASAAFFDGNLWIPEGPVALSVCDRDILTGNVGPIKDGVFSAIFFDASLLPIPPTVKELNYLQVFG